MGSSVSKLFRERKNASNDPRSPTLHISRTPISLLFKQSHGKQITKAQDLTDIRTPLSGSYENIYPRTKQMEMLQSTTTNPIDPRSPSAEIHRTPLILLNNEEVVSEAEAEDCEARDESVSESFESALSKLDFNTSLDDAEGETQEKGLLETQKEGLLETNFDYEPSKDPQVVKDTIDPRSPGIERTPFMFEDEPDTKDCADTTPKSTLNLEDHSRNGMKVFQDENLGQCHTPKQINQEGNRTPLSCLANRATRNAIKDSPSNMFVLKNKNDTENCSVGTYSGVKGMSVKRINSKIPLPMKRIIDQ